MLCAAVLLLSGMLHAQPASYTFINQPPPYSNPANSLLVALNTPKTGAAFQVQMPTNWIWGWAHGPAYSGEYFLLVGSSNPSLDLGAMGIQGFLFSSGEIVIPSTFAGLGVTHTVSIAVPASSSLIGVGFYQQVVELQSVCGYGCGSWAYWPLVLSRGGHGVIGT